MSKTTDYVIEKEQKENDKTNVGLKKKVAKKMKLIQTSKEMTSRGPRMMGFYEDHKGRAHVKPIK